MMRSALLGFLTYSALSLSGPTARADLHFTEVTFDAGEIRSGPVLCHQFAFNCKESESIVLLGLCSNVSEVGATGNGLSNHNRKKLCLARSKSVL